MALRGVSVREYKGGASRARGLNPTIKKFLWNLFNPSPPELRSFGLSPILPMQQQRRRLNTSYPTDKNHIIKEYLKTPPLCFAQQNIGEVARSDGGVKPDNQKILMLSFQPLFSGTSFLRSLPYTATRHRGEG